MKLLQEYQFVPNYPQSNGSIRISFGKIKGHQSHAAQTGLKDLRAQNGPPPYQVPQWLQRSSLASKYVDTSINDIPCNFLTDMDTTSGNSGSPTLNERGELVGIVFDNYYESLFTDWIYSSEESRTIHVDIRYLLYLLEKNPNAKFVLETLE